MHALRMLPTSLVALTASFFVPLISASTGAPVCVSSQQGYATGQVNYLYNNFCQKLANSGFVSDMAVYGMPVISFSFASSGSGIGTCDQNNCLASYKTLVSGCGLANQTIWGTGSIDAGCGTYNYTIWDTAKNPITLGQATTTLVGATMTTAATIATSTSTSAQATSTSSEPTLILESISSSTTGSSSIEPSDITSSSLLPTAMSYANSTSASNVAVVTSANSSPVAVASGTTSGKVSTTTKPEVGTTALGSGADIVKVSGLTLVAVACVFAGFM